MAEIEISRLLQSVRFDGPVLDMGFGHGVVANAIIKKVGHCAVVEESFELVAHAQQIFGERINMYHSSFEEFHPRERFATVLGTAVLHHVSDPLAVLERIKSWLAPGGKLLVTTPNAESIHRANAVARGWESDLSSVSSTGKQMGVVRTFTSPQLKELIQRAGFSIVQQHPSFLKFVPYAEMAQLTTPQLDSLFDIASLCPTDLHATIIFEATLPSGD